MATKRSGGIVRLALLALAVVGLVGLAGLCSGCGDDAVAPVCGAAGLPCCTGDAAPDGASPCAAGLSCGGGEPGVCALAAAARSELRSYDTGGGDVSAPTCNDVGAECCPSPYGGYCVGSAYGFPLVCYQGTCWVSVGPPPIPGYTPITTPTK